MPACDTSSIIHGWEHYPIDQFPGLWDWLAEQVSSGDLHFCEVVIEEADKNAPDCCEWMRGHNCTVSPVTNETLTLAARIEERLQIVGQRYNQAGVGEYDIIIIASAQEHAHDLLANEARQKDWQKKKVFAKYKMPTVCQLPEVAVPSRNFIEYLRDSGVVFDRLERS